MYKFMAVEQDPPYNSMCAYMCIVPEAHVLCTNINYPNLSLHDITMCSIVPV